MVITEGGPYKSRCSWDPLTTLVAVRGIEGVPSVAACTNCDGANKIDAASGNNEWVSGANKSNQTYLVLKDAVAAGNALDELLCQWPKHLKRAGEEGLGEAITSENIESEERESIEIYQ